MTKIVLQVLIACTLMIMTSSSVFSQGEVWNFPDGWKAKSLTFDENGVPAVLVSYRTAKGMKWIVAQRENGKWLEHEVKCSDQIDTLGEYFRLAFLVDTWYMYRGERLFWSPSLDSCFSLVSLSSRAVRPLRVWRKPIQLADQVYFTCESNEILKIDTMGTQVVTTVSPGSEIFQTVGGICTSIKHSNSTATGIREFSVPFDGWGASLSVVTTPDFFSPAPKSILSIPEGVVSQDLRGSTLLGQASVIDARLIGARLYFMTNGVYGLEEKFFPTMCIVKADNQSVLEYPLPDSVVICYDVANTEDNFFIATDRGLFTKLGVRDITLFSLEYHTGLPAEVEYDRKAVSSLGISNEILYALKSNRVFTVPISAFEVTSVSNIYSEVSESSIYPNPASGNYVSIQLPNTFITDIKVLSAHGETLNVGVANDGKIVTVQTAQLGAGTYFLVGIHEGRRFVRSFTVLR